MTDVFLKIDFSPTAFIVPCREYGSDRYNNFQALEMYGEKIGSPNSYFWPGAFLTESGIFWNQYNIVEGEGGCGWTYTGIQVAAYSVMKVDSRIVKVTTERPERELEAYYASQGWGPSYEYINGERRLQWTPIYGDYEPVTLTGAGPDIEIGISDYVWVKVSTDARRFTSKTDEMDFNEFSGGGLYWKGNPYDAQSGHDDVILPSEENASSIVNLQGNSVFRYKKTFEFAAGEGNDRVDASLVDTKDITLSGGAGNDTLIAGGGDDTLRGGADDDTLRGGGGDDTFIPGRGIDKVFGGNTDKLGRKWFDEDTLVLKGGRDDYDFRDSSDGSRTFITHRSDPDIKVVSEGIERIEFENAIQSKSPDGRGWIWHGVKAAANAYLNAFTSDDGLWLSVHANQLGMRTTSKSLDDFKWLMVNGVYSASPKGLGSIFGEAVAHIGQSNIDGTQTLLIAFRGTNIVPTEAFDIVTGWGPQMGNHYEYFRPLLEGLKTFIADPVNGIEHVVVSGHSLGGGMAQYFMDEFADGKGVSYNSVSIGSSGFPSLTDNSDPRALNFEHTEDLVPLAPFEKTGEIIRISQDNIYSTQDDEIGTFEHNSELYVKNIGNLFKVKPVLDFIEAGSFNPYKTSYLVAGTKAADNFAGDDGEGDRMWGLGGSDTILGLKGDDRIFGNKGNDTLVGGKGTDHLIGGKDGDTFVFRKGSETDVIVDFEDNRDEIRISTSIWGGGLSKAGMLDKYATKDAVGVTLDFGKQELVIKGLGSIGALVDDLVLV